VQRTTAIDQPWRGRGTVTVLDIARVTRFFNVWYCRPIGVCAGLVELVHLLVKVLIKVGALDESGVRFFELFAIERYKYDLDVINELVDPAEVEERSIDDLVSVSRNKS
jgi:hypothetical protein